MEKNRFKSSAIVMGLILALILGAGWRGKAVAQCGGVEFTSDFRLEECKFKPIGANPYFILLPGYQLYLEGEEEGEEISILITVLPDIKTIDLPDYGKVVTRVVEEREWADGELMEVSRNYFAICKQTNDVFYFGEDVDIYEDGEIVSHEGAWLAGTDGAKPGIIMPGRFLLGSRYYQEQAPGIAEDLATNVEMGLAISTEAGDFENCVRVVETSALDCTEESVKIYCPKIGLVIDDIAELIDYGFRLQGIDGNGN